MESAMSWSSSLSKCLWVSLMVWLWHCSLVHSLEVECTFESSRQRLTCACIGADGSTNSRYGQDLAAVVSDYTDNRFTNLYFQHIELRNCRNVKINLDLSAFYVDGRVQSIRDVSFVDISSLELHISEVAMGRKRLLFENIGFLAISGHLTEPSASVSFYVRNMPDVDGDVVFRSFYARSIIDIINIQDVRSVRVYDSNFEGLREAEVLRADRGCFLGEFESMPVPCRREQLFVTTAPFPLFFSDVVSSPWFILAVGLFILLVISIIFCCIYSRYQRKKKELELLGYPPVGAPSSISRGTTPPPVNPSGRLSARSTSQMKY